MSLHIGSFKGNQITNVVAREKGKQDNAKKQAVKALAGAIEDVTDASAQVVNPNATQAYIRNEYGKEEYLKGLDDRARNAFDKVPDIIGNAKKGPVA